MAERTLILGTSPLARAIVKEIEARPHRYSVIGVVGEGRVAEASAFDCPFLGTLEDLQRIIGAYRPQRIVVALHERRNRLPVDQLVEARARYNVVVEPGVDVYESLAGKLAIESLTPSNVIFSHEFRPSETGQFCARVLSCAAAAAGLILCLPLFLLLALVVKLDSPGPALFVQARVGLNGRPFRLFKFRSMRVTGSGRSEWECDNGHRITRSGAWLRKYRLDELPQLINVLRGDMNLVGPRPHPSSNFEMFVLVSRNTPQYGLSIPYYSLRSSVRPGITGWAQVRYKYANGLGEEIEKLRYDLYYIKHHSLFLDLRILVETVMVVLLGGTTVHPADSAISERQP